MTNTLKSDILRGCYDEWRIKRVHTCHIKRVHTCHTKRVHTCRIKRVHTEYIKWLHSCTMYKEMNGVISRECEAMHRWRNATHQWVRVATSRGCVAYTMCRRRIKTVLTQCTVEWMQDTEPTIWVPHQECVGHFIKKVQVVCIIYYIVIVYWCYNTHLYMYVLSSVWPIHNLMRYHVFFKRGCFTAYEHNVYDIYLLYDVCGTHQCTFKRVCV
jgi:hypothetical protein